MDMLKLQIFFMYFQVFSAGKQNLDKPAGIRNHSPHICSSPNMSPVRPVGAKLEFD